MPISLTNLKVIGLPIHAHFPNYLYFIIDLFLIDFSLFRMHNCWYLQIVVILIIIKTDSFCEYEYVQLENRLQNLLIAQQM